MTTVHSKIIETMHTLQDTEKPLDITNAILITRQVKTLYV